MTTNQDESGTESGKEFREKFEATQAENSTLRSTIAEQLGVNAEDLKGVPADQLVTKATEIKNAQKAQEEAVLRKHLGLGEDDDLEAALQKLKGGEGATETQKEKTTSPFTSTDRLGGHTVGNLPEQNLRGRKRIEAAIVAKRNNSNS